jgi:alpha-ketoglutarate-dependent taurine dioxygenase
LEKYQVEVKPLCPGQPLPILVTPERGTTGSFEIFRQWATTHGSLIDHYIHKAGVLLIRGFQISSPQDFRAACSAIRPDLRNYTGGDSPRNDVCDQVYTSTEYPCHLEVLLHNELSYAGWCPEMVFFCCLYAPRSGGETPIADGRKIYAHLNPEVRVRFEHKEVMYFQHLRDTNGRPGPGKSWQETFETMDKAVVEKYLVESGMNFEWTEFGIRTAAKKPAVCDHPVTGEKCWHNQADQWHRDMISVKDSVSGPGNDPQAPTAGLETPGNHVCFGDGSPIDVADLKHIRKVSRQCEVVFPWQEGDIMAIDNILAMHGRKPFTGNRRILVAMA